MKHNFTFLLLASIIILIVSIVLFSCRKEKNFLSERIVEEACIIQTENPVGRSYSSEAIIAISDAKKYCGLLPLNSKNYWVYLDSIYIDGVFAKVQYDTLRYSPVFKSLSDGLIWWESNFSAGLPEILYSNDSALFTIENRFFTEGIKDVKKDFSLFTGDTSKYLTSFEDAAAMGLSVKLTTAFKVLAGSFNDCIYIEKYARNYRRDQVFFKPGVGVVKYIQEKTQIALRQLKPRYVLTLVAFHLE